MTLETPINKGKSPRTRAGNAGAVAHATPKSCQDINVLIACEESQAECLAFLDRGFNAFSCDIQPCRKSGRPDRHIMGDCTQLIQGSTRFTTMDGKLHQVDKWNLIIAHPPCTYLCKVGSVQMYEGPLDNRRINPARYKKMLEAREFFLMCLAADADYVAVENPIPMKMADLPKPDCYACPSWYGVKYTKKTLYWLRGLPPLMPQVINPDAKCFVHASRGKYRSRTFVQLAQAIARQWGDFILTESAR